MADTWTQRDLPVLVWLVEQLDEPDRGSIDVSELPAALDMSESDVQRALKALDEAEPPYFKGLRTAQTAYPIKVLSVTERARRTVGAWPTPESLAEALGRALVTASESEPDPVRKSKLRELGSFTLGAGRDLLVDVTSAVITRSTGLS